MPPTMQSPTLNEAFKATAFFSVLCILLVRVPLLGLFGTFFLPVPVIYYRLKLGRQMGALMALTGLIVQWVVATPSAFDGVFFLGLVGMGFLLGEFFEAGHVIEEAIIKALVIVVSVCGVLLIFINLVSEPSLFDQMTQFMSKRVRDAFDAFQSQEMPASDLEESARARDQFVVWTVRTIPGQMISSILFIAWVSTLLARKILTERGLPFPSSKPLNRWRAPEYLVWVVIFLGICLLIPTTGTRILGANGLWILAPVYFFQGMAIVVFYLFKKGVPRPFRIFLYMLIAIQPFIWPVVPLVGLFDVWLNLRRINSNNHPNDQPAT